MMPNSTSRTGNSEQVAAQAAVKSEFENQPANAARLLITLEQLLAIESMEIKPSLDQAGTLIAQALNGDKVDVFLYTAELDALVAMGVSQTPLGQLEKELGLDVLAVANGGCAVATFLNKKSSMNGHVEDDPEELIGVKRDLAIRSSISVPLHVAGEVRGVLQVDSLHNDAFSEHDQRFMEAVAVWIGMIAHRAELVEQARREAREEARRASAEELITIIAHDLGNYLTPLMGRADLVRRRATREGHSDNFEDANELVASLRRLSTMIDDLLDVGRLERSLFSVQRRSCDLTELVRETARQLSTINAPISVEATPIKAVVDAARLRQALENLLSNAMKHSPPNAPVWLTLAREAREGAQWALITVRDAGPGIDPEILPRLFRRFAPGPGSRGLGLGLYLAEGIARAHGGTLTVQSVPGEGASFTLALPIGGQVLADAQPN